LILISEGRLRILLLRAAINGDAAASVTANASGAVVTLTAKTAGAATNYSLASSSATNDVADFGAPSFTAQASGSTLSGGTNVGYTTFYDTGNVTVTVNGFSKSSLYSQGATSSSIAGDLANQFNGDSNSPVIANASGGVLSLTTKATGISTNYPLATNAATNSQYFTSGSTSFSGSPSGNTLTLGQNGTIYDAGMVTVKITGFTATPMSYTANYSQGSTGNSVASALAGAINGNSLSPITATVSAGSNVISLTAKTLGADTNYGITATSATTQGAYFSQPSFSSSGTTLSGGTDPSVSLTNPLSTFSIYDAMGNLLKVIQGQQARTYQYDSLGRMTSSCVPEMNNQCTTYTYKDFGAVATKLDPRSITTTYAYDNWAHLQTITYSDGTPTVTYTYGAPGASNLAAGRVTNVSNSSASEAYTYDNMGRITKCVKTIAGQSYTISYHYTNGQLDYTTYPSGRVVYRDHDAIGRLNQVRTGGTTVWSAGSFNAAGEVLTTTYGNGMTGTYTYNNQLQLASILTANTSTPVLNLSYSYGGASDNGQITGITDGINGARSMTYLYDELGRLKIAQTTDLTSPNTWKLKFGYDRYGNRLSEIPAAGTASMPINEVAVDSTTNRLTNLVYDADGNVINDNFHTYAYNALNQITSVDGANNTYAYDPNGLRVNRNGTVYIYSGSQRITEYANAAAANSPSVEYIYAGGRVAKIVSGAITYTYRDHLSTRVEADGSATVSRTFGHFPFGEMWYETGSASKWKFTTYERDSESGLDYANARFNSSSQGRFMSIDPLAGRIGYPQSLNRYAYAANDPINLIDPSGARADHTMFCTAGDMPGDAHFCAGGGGGFVDGVWTFFVGNLLQSGFFWDCSQVSCGAIEQRETPPSENTASGTQNDQETEVTDEPSSDPQSTLETGDDRPCTAEEQGGADTCVHADAAWLDLPVPFASGTLSGCVQMATFGIVPNCLTNGQMMARAIVEKMSKSELTRVVANSCIRNEFIGDVWNGPRIAVAFLFGLLHGVASGGIAAAGAADVEIVKAMVDCAGRGEYSPAFSFQ
jgi:RHS repeat-associated protein